eukprot:CAMPEP_0119532048 /NCGR_PEP_ID=MMETSP1344-20130328/45627_1 /TAXON_ID=236787 /ORGANISM="Florenciella parvula, Strain CCMP2471" /LENGTH=256 /DNA_ID=CAMNT_0007572443 /DNA_START=52 /DNA_END=819 /DNA_ORIENTATION=-
MTSPPVVAVCKSRSPSKTEIIEWQIEQWSSLPSGHSVGHRDSESYRQGRTSSEIMQAVGEKWQIVVFPGGMSKGADTAEELQRKKEHVAIYLHYKGDCPALRAKYSITLVNQLPGNVDETGRGSTTFGQVNSGTSTDNIGWSNFIKRSRLEDESRGWKVNDRVIIRATITTFGDLESTVAAAAPAFTPPNTVTTDLESMLNSGEASDIALYVAGREFKAHRVILRARSPYFKGLLSSSMRDADADGLPIADTEPDV